MSLNKKRKTGPKPKPRNEIKRMLTCTVDQDVLRALTKHVSANKYGSRSEAVNQILRKEFELCQTQ